MRKLWLVQSAIQILVERLNDTGAKRALPIGVPYQKRSQKLAELFPKLFVEGLATRDFEPALRCLLGQAAALSPATIVRLNAQFKAEYDEWRQRSLAEQRFVYIWVDGVHIKAGVARENAAVKLANGISFHQEQDHFDVISFGRPGSVICIPVRNYKNRHEVVAGFPDMDRIRRLLPESRYAYEFRVRMESCVARKTGSHKIG